MQAETDEIVRLKGFVAIYWNNIAHAERDIATFKM